MVFKLLKDAGMWFCSKTYNLLGPSTIITTDKRPFALLLDSPKAPLLVFFSATALFPSGHFQNPIRPEV
jgi:hypothetical protein